VLANIPPFLSPPTRRQRQADSGRFHVPVRCSKVGCDGAAVGFGPREQNPWAKSRKSSRGYRLTGRAANEQPLLTVTSPGQLSSPPLRQPNNARTTQDVARMGLMTFAAENERLSPPMQLVRLRISWRISVLPAVSPSADEQRGSRTG